MRVRIYAVAISFLSVSAPAQTAAADPTSKITLSVPPGVPLRLYLAKRVPKRVGAPVEAKLLESVFAFDREVLPAGTIARGRVDLVVPVGKWRRAMAMINGDFTPFRRAEIKFTTLTLPDGRTLATSTADCVGLNSIYVEPRKTKKPSKTHTVNQNGGILGTAKQTAKDRINGAINARSRGVADIVRGPDKKERLVDFLWSKLPYHPQYLRRGTRLDAPLLQPLAFGSETVKQSVLAGLGSKPAPDSVVHTRLLTALDSSSAVLGQEVKAVVSAPLFSAEHRLVYPEGTVLTGTVVVARKARSFHRPGQLRFSFQRVDLPPEVAKAASPAPFTTQATLKAAEAGGSAPIKVDSEGGVQAQESKTRFIAPVISLAIASRAADNDAGRHHATGGGDANVSGRTLGGGSGFGLLGAAAAQSSRYVGMAFGYYGLAWSIYSSVIARGGEVEFDRNAAMDIQFGARAPK